MGTLLSKINKPEQAIELHSNPKKKIIKMSENDLGQNRILDKKFSRKIFASRNSPEQIESKNTHFKKTGQCTQNPDFGIREKSGTKKP